MSEKEVSTSIKVLHEPTRIKRLTELKRGYRDDLGLRYNELVDAFNQLSDEYALVNTFTQAVFQSDPPKPNERIKRSVALALYLKKGAKREIAVEAISEILVSLGYEPIIDSEMDGSFFKRLVGLSKDFVTQDQVQHEIKKLKRHIENQTVARSQAEIDEKLANAVSKLLAATKDEESVFMFGSFVIVKILDGDGKFKTAVKSLSSDEQIVLSMEQSLFTEPSKFFVNLQSRVHQYQLNIKTEGSDNPKALSEDVG